MIIINKKFRLDIDTLPSGADKNGEITFHKKGSICKLRSVSNGLAEIVWIDDVWNPYYLSVEEIEKYFTPLK